MKKFLFFLIIVVFFSSRCFASSTSLLVNFNISSNVSSSYTYPDIIRTSWVMLQINTDKIADCKYSQVSNLDYNSMEGVFDYSLDTIFKKNFAGLSDGTYNLYVKCIDSLGVRSNEMAITFNTISPVSTKIFYPDDNIHLKGGRTEINLVTSKPVSQMPLLSYTLNGLSYDSVPLIGVGSNWKGYIIIPLDSKEKVGSFKFGARDFDGVLGEEIISGGVFLIDTLRPGTIVDIRGIGYENNINLKWYLESDYSKFRIYRSTLQNPDYIDFYKEINTLNFVDTSVEKGKTYFYRVSAVDEAGNEGDLSPVVSATVLFENNSVVDGLPVEFLSLVDNSLVEVEAIKSRIGSLESSFSSGSELDSQLYQELELSKDVASAKSEIESLKKELALYKTQTLSKSELERKLDSISVKVAVIKKKVPESITLKEQNHVVKSLQESDINRILLESFPSYTEEENNQIISDSKSLINGQFKGDTYGYSFDITYMDGSRKSYTLIRESLGSNIVQNNNYSIMLYVPKEIASSVSEFSVKKLNYQVLKDDPILSFDSSVRSISYVLNKELDLSGIKDTKVLAVANLKTIQQGDSVITGNSISEDFGGKTSYVIILSFILVLILSGYYLIHIRKMNNGLESISDVGDILESLERFMFEGDLSSTVKYYGILQEKYRVLTKKDKLELYNKLSKIHELITIATNFKKVCKLSKDNLPAAGDLMRSVSDQYSKLASEERSKLHNFYLEASKSL